MAKSHPRGHRPTDSPDTLTREWWEQEVGALAFRHFDQIAQGRRTFTLRELRAMPEALQRCIKSIKVRPVTNAGDGTDDQVVDVTLWGKTRALKLAARAGMRPDRLEVTTTSEETLAILDRRKLRNRGEQQR
jgi:hypothetical protein